MSSRYTWTEKSTNILLTFLETHHKLFTPDNRNEGYLAAAECLNAHEEDPLKKEKCNDFKVHSKLQGIYRSEEPSVRNSIEFSTWLSNGRFRTVAWRAANIGPCTRGQKESGQNMSLEEAVSQDSDGEGSASEESCEKKSFFIHIPKPLKRPLRDLMAPDVGPGTAQPSRKSSSKKSRELVPKEENSQQSKPTSTKQKPETQLVRIAGTSRPQSYSFEDREFNDKSVGESMAKIYQLIIDVVGAIRKIVVIDEYCWTQLSDTHVWFGELHGLFSAGLGLGDGEILEVAFRRLKVDLKDLRSYIRMLIAVSVYKQALTSKFPDFPIPSRAWARKFAQVQEDPERLDQIAQSTLVTLSENEEFLESTLPKKAGDLAYEVINTLSPMLTAFRSHTIDRESGRGRTQILWNHCGETMTEIFDAALRLRTEVNLKDRTYDFFWPNSGVPFDENIMDEEVFQRRTQVSKSDRYDQGTVIMTLLPGVRRFSPPSRNRQSKGKKMTGANKADSGSLREEGKVILPALVLRDAGGEA